MQPPTHAEQNRLITENMSMVEPIAGLHRTGDVPFDDMVAAGGEGLVKAARTFNPKHSRFTTWAYRHIEQEILNFIRDWRASSAEPVGLLNAEGDERHYEWSVYKTPYEAWDQLAASPEELRIAFEELAHTRNSLEGALIGLSKRDRAIITARFLKEPNQTLESIARDHKISYARVVFLVDRSLKYLKKVLSNAAVA